MTARALLLTMAILLMFAGDAFAVKLLIRMKPGRLGEGFSFRAEPSKDARVRITITRDLSEARSFDASSELMVVRTGTLAVYGPSGLVARCPVAPQERSNDNTLVYQFVLDREYAARSQFTLAEVDDYKDRSGYLGGGQFYQFKLADFLDDEDQVNKASRPAP